MKLKTYRPKQTVYTHTQINNKNNKKSVSLHTELVSHQKEVKTETWRKEWAKKCKRDIKIYDSSPRFSEEKKVSNGNRGYKLFSVQITVAFWQGYTHFHPQARLKKRSLEAEDINK